jgi:SOS response associated peptidase (SRAP)
MDRSGSAPSLSASTRKDGLTAFVALWERWWNKKGGEIDTVAIITCDANATVAPLHDRMPVVLGQEHFEAWLDCKGIGGGSGARRVAAASGRLVRGDRNASEAQRLAPRRARDTRAAADADAIVSDFSA